MNDSAIERRLNMHAIIGLAALAVLGLPNIAFAADEVPSVDDARQAIERRLMAAKPTDATERNVVLQNVQAETSNNGAFWATAIIRDYSPGFPLNHFYGETCIGRVVAQGDNPGWRFVVTRNGLGNWEAEGRTTLQSSEGRKCTPNPSEGVSSMPLAGLQ
jgi:hypothetical protein